MAKLILLSIIIAGVAIPTRASRTPNARAGFKKLIKWVIVFNVLYMLALRFLYMRLV